MKDIVVDTLSADRLLVAVLKTPSSTILFVLVSLILIEYPKTVSVCVFNNELKSNVGVPAIPYSTPLNAKEIAAVLSRSLVFCILNSSIKYLEPRVYNSPVT